MAATLTADPRARAVRDALTRSRDALHNLLDELDCAIAAWDALDDDRITIAQRGITEARAVLHGGARDDEDNDHLEDRVRLLERGPVR